LLVKESKGGEVNVQLVNQIEERESQELARSGSRSVWKNQKEKRRQKKRLNIYISRDNRIHVEAVG